MTQSIHFKFIPLNFSWIALHPKPVGTIYFIGGAFFGTFPTIFYRFLLRHLFDRGYTIVALPYRFTLRHWDVATGLASDQCTLQQVLIEEAQYRGYEAQIYEDLENGKHFWLGHSLGCKYIALLEVLTDFEMHDCGKQNLLSNCIPLAGQKALKQALVHADLSRFSLRNQSSILLAPAIEGLEGAIPILRNPMFSNFQKWLDQIGIKVDPSQAETFCLAKQGQSFNLTSLIAFRGDTRVAAPTVRWLLKNLEDRLLRTEQLEGRHLAPLGWTRGNLEISKTVERFLQRSTAQVESFLKESKESAVVMAGTPDSAK